MTSRPSVYHARLTCFLLFLLVFGALFRFATAADVDNETVKELIIAGIQSNFDTLPPLRLKLEQVEIDKAQKENKVERLTVGSDPKSVVEIQYSPKRIQRHEIVTRGGLVRATCTDESGSSLYDFAFDGVVWRSFTTGDVLQYTRRSDQLPGMLPVDPRHFPSNSIRTPLISFVQSFGKPKCYFRTSTNGEEVAVLEATLGVREEAVYAVTLTFAKSISFLPTGAVYTRNATVMSMENISYQDVAQNGGPPCFVLKDRKGYYNPTKSVAAGTDAVSEDQWDRISHFHVTDVVILADADTPMKVFTTVNAPEHIKQVDITKPVPENPKILPKKSKAVTVIDTKANHLSYVLYGNCILLGFAACGYIFFRRGRDGTGAKH